jgi:DNA-binding XRE family transcriptional regulator
MPGLAETSGIRRGAALRESRSIEDAHRALGTELAACRRAAGHSQEELAALVGYSRSTIANVETGGQSVPRFVLPDLAVGARLCPGSSSRGRAS